jgi:hypothetical protein
VNTPSELMDHFEPIFLKAFFIQKPSTYKSLSRSEFIFDFMILTFINEEECGWIPYVRKSKGDLQGNPALDDQVFTLNLTHL